MYQLHKNVKKMTYEAVIVLGIIISPFSLQNLSLESMRDGFNFILPQSSNPKLTAPFTLEKVFSRESLENQEQMRSYWKCRGGVSTVQSTAAVDYTYNTLHTYCMFNDLPLQNVFSSFLNSYSVELFTLILLSCLIDKLHNILYNLI